MMMSYGLTIQIIQFLTDSSTNGLFSHPNAQGFNVIVFTVIVDQFRHFASEHIADRLTRSDYMMTERSWCVSRIKILVREMSYVTRLPSSHRPSDTAIGASKGHDLLFIFTNFLLLSNGECLLREIERERER